MRSRDDPMIMVSPAQVSRQDTEHAQSTASEWGRTTPAAAEDAIQPPYGAPGPRVAAPRRARTVALIAAAVLGISSWLFYAWKLSLTVPAGLDLFDFANNFLYAGDMVHGNWLLHGWVVTQDPHWLTDDLVYALGLSVRGFDPSLLHAVPVVVYTALVALAAVASIALLNLRAMERLMVIGIAVLPLVFPSRTLSSQVLVGPYHTGTTAVALGAILALAFQEGRRSRAVRIALVVLAGALLAIGRIGDPYMLTLGIAPLMLVALYEGLVRRTSPRTPGVFLPLWVALAAWAAAAGVLWLVPALGGFTMRASLAPFMPLSELGSRLLSFVGTFLDLSGGNIFGLALGSLLLFTVVRLAYLCAAVWAVARVLGDLRRGCPQDWTTATLAIAVLGSALGTFLYGPRDYLGNEHRAPVFLLMGIVLARHLATAHREWLSHLAGRRAAAVGLACAAFLFAALPIDQFQRPKGFDDPSRFPQLALARWLDARGLRHGYGPYDEASIITVEARGRVTVRPLISTSQYTSLPPAARRLIPNIELMANSAWFTADQPATFLIVDNGDVDARTALQTFGKPDRVYRVAAFQVFTWTKGIACTLPQSTPGVRAEERAGAPPQGASCRRLE